MGRGSNTSAGHSALPHGLFETYQEVVKDVIGAFNADCISHLPRGATLRVFDREDGRRILCGEADVTQVAGRILYFTLSPQQLREAWSGEHEDLVRFIAVGLYGDENALRLAR